MVEGGDSPKTVDDTKASRIVMTCQSANPFDAAVVVDGDPVTARYARMLFTNPTGAPLLGGPAEVETRLAAHAEAQRHGPKAERHRGKAGHGKVKAGKQHTGSKDQKVKKDQHQGHNDRNGRKNHKKGEAQTPQRAAGTRRVTFQLPTRAVGS